VLFRSRGGVQRFGGTRAHQLVNFIHHGTGGGEVGLVEVENKAVTTAEGAGGGLFHRGAVGNAAGTGDVNGNAGAVVALGAKTTYHQVALGHGVHATLGAFQRSK